MKNRVITMHTNSDMNTVDTFRNAVRSGRIKEFAIVGRYDGTNDYLIARSEMPVTSEINLAAQLQSSVNVRVTQEHVANMPIAFSEDPDDLE